MSPATLATISLVLTLLAPLGVGAAPKISELARKLAAMRLEVDRLDAQLRALRSRSLGRQQTLEERRRKLLLEVDAQLVARKRLRASITKAKLSQTTREQTQAALAKAVIQGLDRLARYQRASMPFRLAARERSVKRLRRQLQTQQVSGADASLKLWRLVEAEVALTRGIERAEISLALGPGKPRLVQVVRLGMLTMFVKDATGALSRVVRRGPRWVELPLRRPGQRRQVNALFEALKRQLRRGNYRLPLSSGASR